MSLTSVLSTTGLASMALSSPSLTCVPTRPTGDLGVLVAVIVDEVVLVRGGSEVRGVVVWRGVV